MTEANEPTNIIWENLGSIEKGMSFTKSHQFGWKLFAGLMIVLFLIVCFSLTVLLKMESASN
jgi:hypothetical protein